MKLKATVHAAAAFIFSIAMLATSAAHAALSADELAKLAQNPVGK